MGPGYRPAPPRRPGGGSRSWVESPRGLLLSNDLCLGAPDHPHKSIGVGSIFTSADWRLTCVAERQVVHGACKSQLLYLKKYLQAVSQFLNTILITGRSATAVSQHWENLAAVTAHPSIKKQASSVKKIRLSSSLLQRETWLSW